MNLHTKYWNQKVVLITGSARGIGRKTAEFLLLAGAKVVINARNPDHLKTCRETWEQDSRFFAFPFQERLLSVQADASSPEEAPSLVQAALERFGRIDLLINNAGLSMRGAITDIAPAVVRNIFASNFDTAFFMTQAALGPLEESRGRVCFISSLAGLRGFPGVSVYSAAKAAVAVFRQSLAAEHPIIRSTIVYLGFTENDREKTIFAANGEMIRHERRWQMTQEQAALSILKALRLRKPQAVLTHQGRLLAFFQGHFPRLVDWLLARSRGRVHQIQKKG